MKSKDAIRLAKKANYARIRDEIDSNVERAAAKVNREFSDGCNFCDGKGVTVSVIRTPNQPEINFDACCTDAQKEAERRLFELGQDAQS